MSRQPWSTNSARTVSNSEITQAEDAVTIYRPESAQHSHLRTQTMRMTPEEDGESVVRRASAGRSFNGNNKYQPSLELTELLESLKDPSFHPEPVSMSMDSLDAQLMGRNEDQLSLARVSCLNENAAQHTAPISNENLSSSPSNMPTVVCRPIASNMPAPPIPAPRSLPFRQIESSQPMQSALPGIRENVPHCLNPIAMQSQSISPSASSIAPQLPPVAPRRLSPISPSTQKTNQNAPPSDTVTHVSSPLDRQSGSTLTSQTVGARKDLVPPTPLYNPQHLRNASLPRNSPTASQTRNTSNSGAVVTYRHHQTIAASPTTPNMLRSTSVPEVPRSTHTLPVSRSTSAPKKVGSTAAKENCQRQELMSAAKTFSSGSSMEEEAAMKEFRLKFRLAELKEKSDKLEEALEEYTWALYYEVQARGEHHVEIAKTHKIIARLCLKANKYKQAEEHLLQALKIYRACTIQMADSDAMWNTHDLLAQTYMHLGKKDLEVEHYQRAIEILSNSTDLPPERLAHMHNNIGVTLHKLNRHHESQLHLEKSKEMMTLIHGNTDNEDMAKVHKSLGDLYKDIGRWDEAASEYTSFLKVYSKPAMAAVGQVLSAPVHKALAEIYEIKGNLSKAREHAQLSDQGQEQLNNPENTELMNELAGRLGSGNLMIAAKDANEEVEKAQRYQRENNHQLAIKHYLKAIDCVQNLPPLTRDTHEVTSKLAMIHNNLGNAYRSVSRFAEAKTHMLKALEIRRQLYGDDVCEDTATSLFNLGYIYSQVSDVPNLVESFNCHKEALRMYLQMGISTDTLKWVVGLYRSLASTSYNLGEAQQSVEYYEKARATISQHAQEGDGEMVKQLQAICNNIGNSYKSLKNYKKAEENLKHALDMATALHLGNPDDLEYQNDQAAAYNNLGCLYQEMKQYQKAIEHHRESLTMRRQIAPLYADAATDLPSSLHNIGNAYNSAGELNEALKYYEEEYKVRMNLGEETSDVLISMSKVYEKKGNLSKAEECLRMAGN